MRHGSKNNRTIQITGQNCFGTKCKQVCMDCLVGEYELGWRDWFDPINWPEGKLPVDDDEIEIKPGQKFIVKADQLVC